MTTMMKEILQESATVVSCEKENAQKLSLLAEEVKKRGICNVVASARGSSDNACNTFKYIFETVCGLPVAFAAPAVFTVYHANVSMKNSLVIGVSQSGKAADVLEVIRAANRQNAITVTITNDESSPLAKEGKFHLFCAAGEEKSVAATKTFIAQVYLLLRIASQLSGHKELCESLKEVPALIEKVIALKDSIAKASLRYLEAKDCYVLARGFCYGIAQETALKIMETTYTKAKTFASSDFHHGPFAVLDSSSKVILLAPSDESLKDQKEMFEKIKNTGADITVFTDAAKEFSGANAVIELPACSPYVMPFSMAVCSQLFAESLSVARGLNPDAPRNLNKVTVTK